MAINSFGMSLDWTRKSSDSKKGTKVKAISINVQLRHLRCAFGEAVRLGLIDHNPFEGVRPLRVPPKEAAFLSEADLRSLLKVIPDLEFRNLVVFAFLTAMRLSEITNLRWEWIDFTKQALQVKNYGGFEVKGGRSRWVPMNRWVLEYLQGKERLSEFVFPNEKGGLRNGTTVSRRFKRFVRKAGLDDSIHFHSLRHSGISYYINQGVPPAFVQRLAGHSSSRVTDKYVHVQDVNLLTAIRAVTTPSFN